MIKKLKIFFNKFFKGIFSKKKKIKLGLYGPPNGGKTTLANRICEDWLGEQMGTVSNIAHETREIQVKEEVKIKPKRVQTDAQKQNTIMMREKLKEKRERERLIKIIQEEEEKKKLEEKMIRKALSIKKKLIKKHAILDEISDDDTPIEELPLPPKKYFPKYEKIQHQEPLYRFV
jgi:adenylate kinase family enzyme